jgi:hypothetical protein
VNTSVYVPACVHDTCCGLGDVLWFPPDKEVSEASGRSGYASGVVDKGRDDLTPSLRMPGASDLLRGGLCVVAT